MRRARVVDSHVHFWDPGALSYPWLEDLPALRRPFAFADFPPRADASTDVAVFVEANCSPNQAIDEVRFVTETAPAVAGIVAFVDLTDAQTRGQVLDRLASFERVVGVRQNIQGQPAGFCLHPEFIRGVRDVGARGFTFDLCVTARQLDDAERLVRDCPDTSFVLDHCGKPAIRHGAFTPWADGIERLAQHDHVACKLSGLLTEARSDQLNDSDILPYADHVLRCFGASRMLYGSDWPVVTLAADVNLWRALVDRFTASWSEAERRGFYSENAIRFYNLRLNDTR